MEFNKDDIGYFVGNTIFGDVKDEMRIAKEEIFGPVMQILRLFIFSWRRASDFFS